MSNNELNQRNLNVNKRQSVLGWIDKVTEYAARSDLIPGSTFRIRAEGQSQPASGINLTGSTRTRINLIPDVYNSVAFVKDGKLTVDFTLKSIFDLTGLSTAYATYDFDVVCYWLPFIFENINILFSGDSLLGRDANSRYRTAIQFAKLPADIINNDPNIVTIDKLAQSLTMKQHVSLAYDATHKYYAVSLNFSGTADLSQFEPFFESIPYTTWNSNKLELELDFKNITRALVIFPTRVAGINNFLTLNPQPFTSFYLSNDANSYPVTAELTKITVRSIFVDMIGQILSDEDAADFQSYLASNGGIVYPVHTLTADASSDTQKTTGYGVSFSNLRYVSKAFSLIPGSEFSDVIFPHPGANGLNVKINGNTNHTPIAYQRTSESRYLYDVMDCLNAVDLHGVNPMVSKSIRLYENVITNASVFGGENKSIAMPDNLDDNDETYYGNRSLAYRPNVTGTPQKYKDPMYFLFATSLNIPGMFMTGVGIQPKDFRVAYSYTLIAQSLRPTLGSYSAYANMFTDPQPRVICEHDSYIIMNYTIGNQMLTKSINSQDPMRIVEIE